MRKPVCYVPDKIDREIASKVQSWNSYYVANLRGLYKESKGKDTEDVNELIKFRTELTKEDSKRLLDAIINPIAAYDQLKEAFSTQERVDRVNMIANTFSDVGDALQEANPGIDREDIIKGFFDQSGVFQGGPAFIYSKVYESLKEEMDEYAANGYTEEVEKYRKVFKNWGALVAYANTILRDTEGVKTGVNLTFATDSNFGDYDEETLVERFVADEAPRESWQEVTDSISPFGATSVHVRRMLGRLTHYTSENEEDYDDLGHMRTLPAVRIHQEIMEMLRGIQSESDMVAIMNENIKAKPYLSEILEAFKNDPILRTQFFVDFSKCFQAYSMQDEERNPNGTTRYRIKPLNTLTREKAYKRYAAALSTRNLEADNAIFRYTKTGTSVSAGLAKQLADHIESILGKPEDIFSKFNEATFGNQDRIEFYKLVLPAFGIHLSGSEYETLVKDNSRVNKLNKTLKDLPLILRTAKDNMSFQSLIDKKIGSEAKEGYLKEKLGKIFQVTESLSSEKKVLSRVRFHDNTYYSDVQSSYLGRFIDNIAALARKGDKKKIQAFLEEQFFKNSLFRNSKGKIYNRWLRDLFGSNPRNIKDFINQFTYDKFLGDRNQKFEDFTSKKQALLLINKYFSESKDYSWYPVFVLGDSGASKWIRAKRYSEEEIVDGLYDIFLQEREFQVQLQELKNSLEKQGKSTGSLPVTGKYGLLPFLNDPEYRSKIDLNNLEGSVKGIIREYLEKSFKGFETKISRVGLYNKDDRGNYKYLEGLTYYKKDKRSDALKDEEAIRENLRDYYYNSRFASVMQMNIMTVNPIFYMDGDSTDLQKRYKEIHASGNRVSVEAINPFTGEKYSDRDYQTTVYFNDVKVNPEKTNLEFMQVIAKIYGDKSEVYKTYRDKTSFTDGQGYRTLKSYRAVMGMAGKWNRKCEDAYNEIESIREEIRNNDGEITEEQSKRLADLMVTFQPIKPFMYTLERMQLGDSMFQIPVQIKYAETVMIPELMPKGSKLRDMLEWAENKDVDVIAATTAVKVGSFGSVDVQAATNKDEINSSLDNAIVHKLSYNDYVIQTNVPEHSQGSQLFATQSRKLIMAGLKDVDEKGNTIYYDHYIDGNTVNLGKGQVKLNAYNLNRFYISLIATNMLEDLESFSSTIKDPEKVRQALVQMTVNNNRETKDNLRGYGKGIEHDFLLALFEGGIEHDTAALLLSMFKKQVNKQKINGGSAVQVSAFGITDYEEDKNLKFVRDPKNDANILYAECEIPWDLSYTDSNGKTIALQFNDWCNPDGTLKLGRKLSEDDPHYSDYLSYTDKNGEVHIPLIEEKFPGILSFIAYRIPTEDKYSMLNMKVKRFTLKVNGGGTIKVPAQGTTIAGFDFK